MGGLFDGFRIPATGMAAERLRMQVIAENLANANSTRGVDGQPYRRKSVVLQEAPAGSFGDVLGGVQVVGIVEDRRPGRRVYDPSNPDADKTGYVTMANVDSVTEMVDLITAQRGYEANVQAMNDAKQMFTRTLDILR
jgi:flagellar basal-body rod protein FlgC